MACHYASPLDLVRTLRIVADLQNKTGQATAREIEELARELELWTVQHRHQLEIIGPRATPTNLRTLAAALKTAAKTKKPHAVALNVAESLERLAESLKKEQENR